MCQAKIILREPQGERVFMEDVIHLRIEDNTVWLERLFEEPVPIEATLLEADFLKHTVSLLPLDTP
jgi:predicted RNA-binding protein